MQATDNDQNPASTVPETKKPKKQVGIGTLIGIVLVVAVTAFVAGMRSPDLLAVLANPQGQNNHLPGQLDFKSVQNVYDTLKGEYDGALDTNKLIEGAKKGLVDAAGDPYTVYFTNDEAKQFINDLDGKFSGIGAELEKKGATIVIRATIDDSPARKAGLLEGDVIAKVNDQDASKWSIDQAVSTIRGDKGTTVKLTLLRNQEVKEVSIVRDEIVNPSVKSEVTADNIGYLRVTRFAEDTSALAKQAAAEFKQKNVRGVILDLRGDGGGYLNVAQDLSSLWLPQGKLIVEERGKENNKLYANGAPLLQGTPTVVLIDSGSASASEITAGALRDQGAATLVGEKSFGKGSVQNLLDVSSGGKVKVTIAKWFTPSGVNISKEGIKPDVDVSLNPEEFAAGRDAQKDKAVEVLKK